MQYLRGSSWFRVFLSIWWISIPLHVQNIFQTRIDYMIPAQLEDLVMNIDITNKTFLCEIGIEWGLWRAPEYDDTQGKSVYAVPMISTKINLLLFHPALPNVPLFLISIFRLSGNSHLPNKCLRKSNRMV